MVNGWGSLAVGVHFIMGIYFSTMRYDLTYDKQNALLPEYVVFL